MSKSKVKILILNGPNLNLLGKREEALYGAKTLSDIINDLKEKFGSIAEIEDFQSNCEGDIVTKIQEAKSSSDFIVINAGALTHTSIALRDALLFFEKPFIEVHISNIASREDFRHVSFLSDIASGVIFGCGTYCYKMAVDYILEYLSDQ